MRFETHLPKEKWNKENLMKFILDCRADKGLPIFKSRFAGIRFMGKEGYEVMGLCWAGHNLVGSRMFTNIPKEDLTLIEEGISDWRMLLNKYGTLEDKEKAYKEGIFISGAKIPRFY